MTTRSAPYQPFRAEDVEMERTVLFAELDDLLRSAAGPTAQRDRTLFWLYYLQGLTADEIAGLPGSGLTAKGVESALRRVATWLRTEIADRKTGPHIPAVREAGWTER